jgi:hypothetical protein
MSTEEIVKLLDELITFIEGNFYPEDADMLERLKKLRPLIEAHWG